MPLSTRVLRLMPMDALAALDAAVRQSDDDFLLDDDREEQDGQRDRSRRRPAVPSKLLESQHVVDGDRQGVVSRPASTAPKTKLFHEKMNEKGSSPR